MKPCYDGLSEETKGTSNDKAGRDAKNMKKNIDANDATDLLGAHGASYIPLMDMASRYETDVQMAWM